MKINGCMIYYRIQQYLKVDYAHVTQNNWVKTPMFYNDFFNMDEHIVLVTAWDLEKCLWRVHRAVIICMDPPRKMVDGMEGSNDLIILDDPMSDKMAFNILNHILDHYQEFEQKLNAVLYERQSFQDMVEVITADLELPIALTDANFRYIAYSRSSGEYIREYVSADNEVAESAVHTMQQDETYRLLERQEKAFLYQGGDRMVCRNIRHEGQYVGRLSVILPDEEADAEYCRAVFDCTAEFVQLLYDQYNSFSHASADYRKIHEIMQHIFRNLPADRRSFLELTEHCGCREGDELAVIDLIPRDSGTAMFNTAFACEHLERHFPGSFCTNLDEHIVMLARFPRHGSAAGNSPEEDLGKELRGLHCVAGVSRTIRTLRDFGALTQARKQALYALEYSGGETGTSEGEKGSEEDKADPAGHLLYFFDDHALDYLLQHGSAGTNFRQYGHPALITLKDHDDEFGTCCLETLRMYMDRNMNAVDAARKLYIHRSSFIGRMERLNRLVEMNLDDPRERLYINLTFAMYLPRTSQGSVPMI